MNYLSKTRSVNKSNHVELYNQRSVTSFILFHLLNCVSAISSKREEKKKKKKYKSLVEQDWLEQKKKKRGAGFQ